MRENTRIRVHSILEMFGFACLGAGVATGLNFLLAAEESLLIVLSDLLASLRLLPVAAAVVPLTEAALVVLGGASILYFRPLTTKGAFVCGIAVIGVIAILFP